MASILVLISVGNVLHHLLFFVKDRKELGYGFPSSIPLRLAGLYLLRLLIWYYKITSLIIISQKHTIMGNRFDKNT
ncbi:MAG: hypothetical protein DRP70_08280 [Spirochaetes bacterium]|nr:MAG: hypothetical protein DRP70_08280 [Spirochaetota bacterium]